MKIGLNDTVKRVSNLPFQKIVDETIIVDPHNRLMHSFNEVGSFIWEKLSEAVTINELLEEIDAEYDTADADVKEDVIGFLEELHRQNLVKKH
ncbi:MAG: PqqD family protein [Planctomycetes bacterium]|nr:PqqD family protein [Planctomycetota bacterium]